MELAGTVAVVTGAGSGIGAATVRALAAQGATVAAADVDLDAAKETVARLGAEAGMGEAFYVDVTEPNAVADLRDAVGARLGVPTVVANVAGWDRVQPFLDNDRSLWEKVVAINFMGTVAVTRAFLDGMIARGEGGKVVNVASDAGRVGSMGETVYAGAKGGVIGFTKSLAREMARYQINVNCVCPGPTDTPLFHMQSEKIREALVRAIPFRRIGRPEEVADAIAFFASPRCSYITGQVLSVSGGLTMNG
ncbi:MAG: SDR family oxidoreductase [Streptosporangiales bacterium]|nr:SDR family oxidoreductase [Streptosporangiales bacterium]